MKKFINKPDDFLNESLNGFGKAHSDIIKVSLETSFVSRKNKTKEGKVS
jgi:Dihydroxyacetone kinase